MKKMFVLNEDGVAEWVVAKSKNQAVSFIATVWGIDVLLENYDQFKKDNMAANPHLFVECIAREEDKNTVFTHCEYGELCNKVVTKTIKEFLEDIEEVPYYFACQDY